MIDPNEFDEFIFNAEVVSQPARCFKDVLVAYTEYLKIAEQEQTKRSQIRAWEKATLADIQQKRDLLMTYLDRSFDERSENFRSLFAVVERAMSAGDNQRLALALNAIVELAKSSPFKDLANLSDVQAKLANPDHVWEL